MGFPRHIADLQKHFFPLGVPDKGTGRKEAENPVKRVRHRRSGRRANTVRR